MKFAVDLYSGIGGWTLGMKLSGIHNSRSFEWWKEANKTHNLNFDTNHKEIDIRNINIEKDLQFENEIDFVVGSPPCTQFSFANKGGNGDIKDGLVDIYKFLEVVEYLKPKYWAMENVPRVLKIIEEEIENGSLKRFKKLFTVIEVFDAAEFGLPQHRKRMIAGNFPVNLLNSYKSIASPISMGSVLSSLKGNVVTDPNYGFNLPKKEVTELENEAPLTSIEERINRDSKEFHAIYNKMPFPDKLDRASRTITATCTRVSRESFVVLSDKGYRRLNVRERGVLQGFPITYQFYGNSLSSKFKMIGNAVPPVLTYYIFHSMLETPLNKMLPPKGSSYFHKAPVESVKPSKLGLPNRKYPDNRRFRFAIPNLRYGSGVRFELSNDSNSNWSFKFFYGGSKNIKSILLNEKLSELLIPSFDRNDIRTFKHQIKNLMEKYKSCSSKECQDIWVSKNRNQKAFDFVDAVGSSVNEIINNINWDNIDDNIVNSIVGEENKKLVKHKSSVLTGFYLLSILNKQVFRQ